MEKLHLSAPATSFTHILLLLSVDNSESSERKGSIGIFISKSYTLQSMIFTLN